MTKLIDQTQWYEFARLPYSYAFCPSERAWRLTGKFTYCGSHPYPTSGGSTMLFQRRDTKQRCAVVLINNDKRTPQMVAELLVHEAMHVWRDMCETIGEQKPSAEFEAYGLMHIISDLFEGYRKTRGPLFLKSLRP